MKERALKAASLFAEVVDIALFGATVQHKETRREEKVPRLEKENTGAGKGILFLFLFVIFGGGAFFFLSSGKEEVSAKFQAVKNLVLAIKKSIETIFRK
jgi:hypothetical protein